MPAVAWLLALLLWAAGTLVIPPGNITTIAPGHYRLDSPGSTATAGLQEVIDQCPDTGCVIDIAPGDYKITKTCTEWVKSENPGTGARIDGGDGSQGGGAVLIANKHNLMIRGPGRQAARIIWETDFSDTACGSTTPNGGAAGVFRIDSGPPPASTTDVVIRDISFEAEQTNLAVGATHVQAISAIDIGSAGTIDTVEMSNVYAECKATLQAADCIAIGTGGSNTQSHTPRAVTFQNGFIESSGTGVGVFFGEGMNLWDSWLTSVVEDGFTCSPHLIYKRNGPMDVQRNRFDFSGDSTLCGVGAGTPTIRFIQMDGRSGEDFPGTGLTVVGNIFTVGGSLWADLFFEGLYITGYSFVDISHNKFWCTVDFEDTDDSDRGDGNLDHCRMIVVQVDNTNIDHTICDSDTPCNQAVDVTHNYFLGFMDTLDTWAGDPADDGCPIQIATPSDANDNTEGLFAFNTFKIVDVNGNIDTGTKADGFCGQVSTTYLKKNYIHGNIVIGKPKQCLAGDGITCAEEFDLATQSLTPVISSYTVATLPAANVSTGKVVIVTDSAAGLCTAGGGAIVKWCRSNGAAWVAL